MPIQIPGFLSSSLKTEIFSGFKIVLQVAIITLLAQFHLVSAHGTKHPTRFIAPNGVDQGDCTDSHNPCATVSYAVEMSGKGDNVYIAEGEYSSKGMDVFYLLSGLVEIEAGYSSKDHFTKQEPTKNKTIFYGVPPEYREKIRKMGFQVVTDQKAEEIELSLKEQKLIASFTTMKTSTQPFTACSNGFAGDYECRNIDMQSRVANAALHATAPSLNDIWGFVDMNDNKEYAIVGLQNGTAVVDVTNATSPTTIGYVQGVNSTWRDLKVYQYFDDTDNRYKAYAYVTTEGNQGLQIIDLTDLPNSISLAATIDDFSTAHNIYIANIDYSTGLALDGLNAYIYIAGSNVDNGAFRILDLVDPLSPQLVGTAFSSEGGYVHDLTSLHITDSRTAQCANGHNPCELVIDFNETSVDIWDTTDKQNLVKLSSTTYQNVGYTHSGWWSKDKQFIFIQDETDERNSNSNTTLRTMDISDLTAPFISGRYTGPTQAIDHNGFTVDDYYYMSNYRRGLTILDITNPNQPSETGFFDTFPNPSENTATFAGAWGAYPFLPSGNVLVSDSTYGLFVLKLVDNPSPPPATPPPSTPPADTGSGSGGGSTESILLLLMLLVMGYRRLYFSRPAQ